MKPTSIKKVDMNKLEIVWDDGMKKVYTLEELRDRCPCAGCSGERVLMHEYVPPEPDKSAPGRYELRSVQPVGSYAIQLTWGDGHGTGIYTYEYLRSFG